MKTILVREKALLNIKYEEIVNTYLKLVAFFMELKGQRLPSNISKTVYETPKFMAEEVIFMSLYGLSKRRKLSKFQNYVIWYKCPPTLEERVHIILGTFLSRKFKEYLDSITKLYEIEEKRIQEHGVSSSFVDSLPVPKKMFSNSLEDVDPMEIENRMAGYIEDFELHSLVDKDILRNYVLTQILIEKSHKAILEGNPTRYDLKSLTEQLKTYITILGLSKKDRIDFGSERKRGSIAELALIYEETIKTYHNTEEKFLCEEILMLLDKYDRKDQDGNREISSKTFQIVSGGFSVEEARNFVEEFKKKEKKTLKSY